MIQPTGTRVAGQFSIFSLSLPLRRQRAVTFNPKSPVASSRIRPQFFSFGVSFFPPFFVFPALPEISAGAVRAQHRMRRQRSLPTGWFRAPWSCKSSRRARSPGLIPVVPDAVSPNCAIILLPSIFVFPSFPRQRFANQSASVHRVSGQPMRSTIAMVRPRDRDAVESVETVWAGTVHRNGPTPVPPPARALPE